MEGKKLALIREVKELDAKEDEKFIIQILAIVRRHKWIRERKDKKTGQV